MKNTTTTKPTTVKANAFIWSHRKGEPASASGGYKNAGINPKAVPTKIKLHGKVYTLQNVAEHRQWGSARYTSPAGVQVYIYLV